MAMRVTDKDVQGIIETSANASLVPFIRAANSLVDKVSSNDTASELSTADLKEIERWVSAGLYAIFDQAYTQKKTEDASGMFQTGLSGAGSFEQNDWLRMAMSLDTTGYLAQLNAGSKKGGKIEAGLTWVGQVPSDQTDYVDRD
tara:strand:+ start:61210 stop:61641 length:432 start_codon:yes stop_codon:yes gene_type:complete